MLAIVRAQLRERIRDRQMIDRTPKVAAATLRLAALVLPFLLVCSCAPATGSRSGSSGWPRPSAGFQTVIRTVLLDAGHGGHDPGASHHGLQEKHLALDITRRLRTHLQQSGLNVAMTRDSDRFVKLSHRPAQARRVGADLFVSVHVNANNNRRVSGAEVYYSRESVLTSDGSWPRAITTAEIGIPTTTVRRVLWDLVLGRTRWESQRMASQVCRSLDHRLGVACKVKANRFVVLRESKIPAILVEVGYVSNPAESKRLSSASYRDAAAQAVASGIVSFIRSVGAQHI